MRRVDPRAIAIVVVITLVGVFAFFMTNRQQGVEHREASVGARERSVQVREGDVARRQRVLDRLIDRYHLSHGTAEKLIQIVQTRYVPVAAATAPPSATPRDGGPIVRPPREPRSSQRPNPIPTEPPQGELKPLLCDAGLADELGIDCDPNAPLATQQVLCLLGFDYLFEMDCGPADVDGPETPSPTGRQG